MEQFGLDFTVVYPTLAMYAAHLRDDELRCTVSRAFNLYQADLFREFSDRMTPPRPGRESAPIHGSTAVPGISVE